MFVGSMSAINPGTTRDFAMDFSDDLDPYDPAASVTAILTAVQGTDTNAAAIAMASPTLQGNRVVQLLGGDPPAGFQAGVTYAWEAIVVTISGQKIPHYCHIPCLAIT